MSQTYKCDYLDCKETFPLFEAYQCSVFPNTVMARFLSILPLAGAEMATETFHFCDKHGKEIRQILGPDAVWK